MVRLEFPLTGPPRYRKENISILERDLCRSKMVSSGRTNKQMVFKDEASVKY